MLAVTEGISQPDLLLDGNISPHLFQVKPSHIRAVSDAEVVVWAGEGIERFLPSMVQNQNKDPVMISMADHVGIELRARDKHSDHDHGELDYHLWLDPQNAIQFATLLASELSAIDPSNADQYQHNAADFTVGVQAATEKIKAALSTAVGQQYLIYHDSLQYLENAFGLGEAIIVAPQPQVQAGGKRLRALHNTLAEQQIGCLISEPQFQSPVVNSIAHDLGVQPVMIDPLAVAFEPGADLYADWLLDLATTLADCFAATKSHD